MPPDDEDVAEARARWERAVEEQAELGTPEAEARAAEAFDALGEALEEAARERELEAASGVAARKARAVIALAAPATSMRNTTDLLAPVGPHAVRNAPDLLAPVGPHAVRNAPDLLEPVGPRPTEGIIDLLAPRGFLDEAPLSTGDDPDDPDEELAMIPADDGPPGKKPE